MDIVWLKRDVRIRDHVPLASAAASGRKFILLFIYEPDQLRHESVHGSHINFVNEGIANLNDRLRPAVAGRNVITVRHGEATEVLEELCRSHRVARLLSHEETGHGVSYARDRRVASWCKTHGVEWVEFSQFGVVRGLRKKGGAVAWHSTWQSHLESFLQKDAEEDPLLGGVALRNLELVKSGELLSPTELGLAPDRACDRPKRQKGGETLAIDILNDFLAKRGEKYSGGISSPNSAWTACSRLSPYLAWGQISMRTVWQAAEGKRQEAKGKWARSLKAFVIRLQQRSSYCQRFEMRCSMEHRYMFTGWEHLRQGQTILYGNAKLLGESTEKERLLAFETGQTGYPMVDACMRCLLATGWLNFRMRCMLVSFAVFNLWLDWRSIAGHMARIFLDFDPGIHYPQLQMQAATTGVDLRCYSVTRQAKDQDPSGEFIRKYVPELAGVPNERIHEPWRMKPSHPGYKSRIVDELKTSKASKTIVAAAQQHLASGVPDHMIPVLLRNSADSLEENGEPSTKTRQEGEPVRHSIKQLLQGTASPMQSQAMTHQPTPLTEEAWNCPQCTLLNPAFRSACEACESARPFMTNKRVKTQPPLHEVIDLD